MNATGWRGSRSSSTSPSGRGATAHSWWRPADLGAGRRRLLAALLAAAAAAAAAAGLLTARDAAPDAARLAPADALLFVQAGTDDPLWALARRLPSLRALQDRLPDAGEVAVALTPRGTTVIADGRRVSGPAPDGGATLAGDPAFQRAGLDGPVTLYAPAAGVRRLLLDAPALVRAAAGFAERPEFEGLAAEAEAADGGVRVSARVLRSPDAPAAREFAPALLGRVPAGVAGHLALPGADALAALLARAGAGTTIDALRAALPDAAGLDLDRDVLGPLAAGAGLTIAGGPVLTLTARTSDPALTREALARLQGPLAEELGAGPAFETRPDGGFSLPVNAALQPSYAVAGDVVVASTGEAGLAQTRAAPRGLAQELAMRAVFDDPGGRVEALGFADLRQLLVLGERTGLTTGPVLPGDLSQVRAAGAVVRREESDSTVELFLEIS